MEAPEKAIAKAVTHRGTTAIKPIQPTDLQELANMAEIMLKSGFFRDLQSTAQAAVKIMAGAEYGIPALASQALVHVVEGKVALHYSVIGAKIKESGRYDYRVAKCDRDGAEIIFYERGEEVGRSRFTAEDASRIVYATKNGYKPLSAKLNYKNWDEDMYFARALTRGARRYCPSVFGGPIYVPDELNEIESTVVATPTDAPDLSDLDGVYSIPSESRQDEIVRQIKGEVATNGDRAASHESRDEANESDARATASGDVNERDLVREALDAVKRHVSDRRAALALLSSILGRDVAAFKELTADDAVATLAIVEYAEKLADEKASDFLGYVATFENSRTSDEVDAAFERYTATVEAEREEAEG